MFGSTGLSVIFAFMLDIHTDVSLQRIVDAVTEAAGVALYVRREDLVHPQISGNKLWKLKYNLLEARKSGFETLLAFGGAYSNLLYAVAAVGALYGFRTIGMIRGEERLPLNETLCFARSCGMELRYIDREQYRKKNTENFLADLQDEFGKFYLIPEGGTNLLAVKGCEEIVGDIALDFDYLCCPCGTGGTTAGLLAGLKGRKKVLSFPVLKGGSFLKNVVEEWTEAYAGVRYDNVDFMLDYHFGGYAKMPSELLRFRDGFKRRTGIPTDAVYTAKMFYGIYDLMKKGYFEHGSVIVALHTGGLRPQDYE